MSQCTLCDVELWSGMDEYGPAQAPLCVDCWFVMGAEVETAVRRDEDGLETLRAKRQKELGGGGGQLSLLGLGGGW